MNYTAECPECGAKYRGNRVSHCRDECHRTFWSQKAKVHPWPNPRGDGVVWAKAEPVVLTPPTGARSDEHPTPGVPTTPERENAA